MSAPTVSASQFTSLVEAIEGLLKGKDLQAVLTSLPTALVSAYQLVVQFLDATASVQQSVVVGVLATVLPGLGLPAADLAILQSIAQSLVPEVVALLPKIEQGIVTGFVKAEALVEEECVTCCGALRKWFSAKKAKQD